MSKSLALFDFDGTITKSDTLLEFIRFAKGAIAFTLGLFVLSPVLIMYKLRLLANWKAKQMMLAYFFKGTPLEDFRELCRKFATNEIPALIRPKAMEELLRHQAQGTRVIIVSASAEDWIQPWASSVNAELIATRLEVIEGKITGRFAGKNCFGKEKVRRLQAHLHVADYETIETYSDSISDAPMLNLGTMRHFKPFRK